MSGDDGVLYAVPFVKLHNRNNLRTRQASSEGRGHEFESRRVHQSFQRFS